MLNVQTITEPKPGCVTVRLEGKNSILVFDADSQKSGKVELVPLAPEAVLLLEEHKQEFGYVFNLTASNGAPIHRKSYLASKFICRIGKEAGVIVDPSSSKYASAHDLRRSFGYRWSRRLMPADLKELMRHASIETTMTYYVGQNAQETAKELWRVVGTNFGTIGTPERSTSKQSTRKNPANAGFE